jgi:hypothetical protein
LCALFVVAPIDHGHPFIPNRKVTDSYVWCMVFAFCFGYVIIHWWYQISMDDMVTWTLCVDDTWLSFMPKNVHPIYGLHPQKYNVHNWKYKLGFLLLVFFWARFCQVVSKKRVGKSNKGYFWKKFQKTIRFWGKWG